MVVRLIWRAINPVPALPAGTPLWERDDARFFEHWRIWLAYVLIGLVALHILAALYHRVIKRDGVVARMVRGEA